MADTQSSDRLVSWKEIAAYLRCEERTAQRWEQERGLPVQRIPGEKRSSVYAFKAEIDLWLTAHSQEGGANGAHQSSQGVLERNHQTLQLKARKLLLFRVGVVVTVALALLALGMRTIRSTFAQPPNRIEFSGSKMLAKDINGQVLWSFEFSGEGTARPGVGYAENIAIQDLDGDGSVEVLAGVNVEGDSDAGKSRLDELVCLSSQGKLLWRYRPSESVTFGTQEYGPPWLVRGLLVTGSGASKNIWLTVVHNPWWPSLLIKLNAQGQELAKYVNAGYIYQVVGIRNESGSFVLVGGVNNEYDSGMLAVLREDDPQGVSPQTNGSPYDCKDCITNSPFLYFIFPRSELNRLTSSPYNNVHRIEVSDAGVYVFTHETTAEVGWGSAGIYEFSRELRFRRARLADGYWDFHRKLSKEATINHPPDRCPEWLRPPVPREWLKGVWHELSPEQAVARE